MSPPSLRRYRAERLLRHEFEGLRETVLGSVWGRLRASGVSLDKADLEACYAQAWQGLYMAVLEGQQIASPAGWLVLVTFRRAIEEHRARGRAHRGGGPWPAGARGVRDGALPGTETASGAERDLAAELDDRMRLRHLFEGLRCRMNGREREAAALCYLQGLSRSEAAARMDLSEARMRKLMEGRGAGRPGVAGKVGTLVETIREGGWCEEQGSLMRALAYGILDPQGERYRLALMHRSQCPACRAYVASLRGLAASLPPVLLPWGLGAGVLARATEGVHGGAAASGGVPQGGAAGGGGTSAGLQAGRGLGGALPASGAAGAGGAAGGGWLIAGGPLGAKLAVGCLLALGVGAGCIATLKGGDPERAPHHAPRAASRSRTGSVARAHPTYQVDDLAAGARGGAGAGQSLSAATRPSVASVAPTTPAERAGREFGPEQAVARVAAGSAVTAGEHRAGTARSASSGSGSPPPAAGGESNGAAVSPEQVSAPAPGRSAPPSSGGDSAAAAREFSPG